MQVRVRRDADEQMVLAHVYNRLSNLVSLLTIQIFKDDWSRASTYNILGSPAFAQNYPSMSSPTSPPRGPSPVQDQSYGAVGSSHTYRPVPLVTSNTGESQQSRPFDFNPSPVVPPAGLSSSGNRTLAGTSGSGYSASGNRNIVGIPGSDFSSFGSGLQHESQW